MNLGTYCEHIQALDSLHERAKEIAQLARPQATSMYVDGFDVDRVTVHCSWANYHEEETICFPAEWLFDPDWQSRVAERLAEEQAEANAKRESETAAAERIERRELERLQAKYSK